MEYARMVEIERNIINIFDRRRLELKMSLQTLGEKVYPNDPSPYMRIQGLRKPQANGKPKRLPVGDFMALCEALELDHVRVLIEAAEKN